MQLKPEMGSVSKKTGRISQNTSDQRVRENQDDTISRYDIVRRSVEGGTAPVQERKTGPNPAAQSPVQPLRGIRTRKENEGGEGRPEFREKQSMFDCPQLTSSGRSTDR